jgi:hypothetical protein
MPGLKAANQQKFFASFFQKRSLFKKSSFLKERTFYTRSCRFGGDG